MNLQGIIGKKVSQSQGFLENGTRVPLSSVVVLGNKISQIKTLEKDGYNAIQLGFEIKKRTTKPGIGHAKKAGLEKQPRFLKEIRTDDVTGAVLGSEITASDIFKPGDMVDVTGTSKGKGFAGGVKRHGFKGGPRTHGQSDRERAPGSIGQTTTPGRVYKGKRMAGRMGSDTVTVKNLQVIDVTNDGVLLIKGLIPGSVNSIVTVEKIGEKKNFVPLYKETLPSDELKEETEEAPAQEEVQISEEALKSPQSLDESSTADVEKTSQDAQVSSVVSEPMEATIQDSSQTESPRADQVEEIKTDEVKEETNAS